MVAREKIVVSLPQSLQATLRKFFAILFISLVDQFELLCSLAWRIMRFTGFGAAEKDVNSLGWLFTAVRLWTRETTVTSHNPAETSLTPAKFGSALFLYALYCVHGVLASRRAVTLYLTGHFNHKSTLAFGPQESGI